MDTAAARLSKVRRVSRFGRAACIGLMFVIGLITCALAVGFFAFPESSTCDVGGGPIPCLDMTTAERALAFALMTVFFGLAVKILHHLSGLFGNYARAEIFTRASVRQIRKIGSTVFIVGALQIIMLLGQAVLVGTHQITWPEGRPIPLPFGTFLGGALIMLVAWVMELGTELREESELTV